MSAIGQLHNTGNVVRHCAYGAVGREWVKKIYMSLAKLCSFLLNLSQSFPSRHRRIRNAAARKARGIFVRRLCFLENKGEHGDTKVAIAADSIMENSFDNK
jgi:hypothetical protein